MSTGQYSASGLETSQHTTSTTRQNVDAVVGSDPNGIHPSKPRAEPLTTHGHKPGVLASEADRADEFNIQTLPAGSAPADRTFRPNAEAEVPLTGGNPSAAETILGSNSAELDQGFGHPGQDRPSVGGRK